MTDADLWQTDDCCPACGCLLRQRIAGRRVGHRGVRLRLVGHLAGRPRTEVSR